ncbi:carbohydrate ABC transporter permease [Cohnella soli]|uniref:Carbohydrate ABC transporter permease n=1 Tax=Cohnella soli TaxID=425005 RepID=A0ABW0HVY7_9BACL
MLRSSTREWWTGFWFILPATVLFVAFVYYPFATSVFYSFTEWDSIRPAKFIGWDNYVFLLEDSKMLQAAKNTLMITFFGIVVQNPLSLFLALLLNRSFRTKILLRIAFYLPVVVSLVVTSIVWGNILQYDGLLNGLLEKLGLQAWGRDWLGNTRTVFPTIIALTQWQGLGYCAVIYLAGLQAIPQELYEAAKIDGAKAGSRFMHVTLPMLMPATTIVVFLTIVGGLKMFDIPYIMTGGGPGSASYTITLAIYNAAFRENTYGYAIAAGIVLMLFIMVVTLIQLRMMRRKEVEM